MPDNTAPIRVWIEPAAMERMKAYIRYATGEISGLGQVVIEDGEPVVKEVYLFEQVCGMTDTDLDQAAMSRFLNEWVKAGNDPAELKLWWHSHVNMGCSWSHDDETAIANLKSDWMLSVVGNKKGEFRARLDLWAPFRVTLDSLPFYRLLYVDQEFEDAIKAEVEAKVKVKTYTQTQFSGLRTGSYQSGFYVGDRWTPADPAVPQGPGWWQSYNIDKEDDKPEADHGQKE